jgi:opacity protein-like surface antigen
MSRRTIATVLSLALSLALIPVAAHAAGWEIGLNGGVGLPMGDFKDENLLDAKSGPQGGIDICYHVNDKLAVGVDGSWNQNKHGAEGSVEDLGGGSTLTANKDKFKAIQYGVHGKYMFPMSGSFKPYAMVGVGFYDLKEDYEYTYYDAGTMTSTVFTDESDVSTGYFEQQGARFGFKFGVGGMYMTSPKIGIGVSADYNSISLDKAKFGTVSPGDPEPPSTAPYLSIRARISYHILPQ